MATASYEEMSSLEIQNRTGKPPQRDLNVFWNRSMDAITEKNIGKFLKYSKKTEARISRIMEGNGGEGENLSVSFNAIRHILIVERNWSLAYEMMIDIKKELSESEGIEIPAVV